MIIHRYSRLAFCMIMVFISSSCMKHSLNDITIKNTSQEAITLKILADDKKNFLTINLDDGDQFNTLFYAQLLYNKDKAISKIQLESEHWIYYYFSKKKPTIIWEDNKYPYKFLLTIKPTRYFEEWIVEEKIESKDNNSLIPAIFVMRMLDEKTILKSIQQFSEKELNSLIQELRKHLPIKLIKTINKIKQRATEKKISLLKAYKLVQSDLALEDCKELLMISSQATDAVAITDYLRRILYLTYCALKKIDILQQYHRSMIKKEIYQYNIDDEIEKIQLIDALIWHSLKVVMDISADEYDIEFAEYQKKLNN